MLRIGKLVQLESYRNPQHLGNLLCPLRPPLGLRVPGLAAGGCALRGRNPWHFPAPVGGVLWSRALKNQSQLGE